MAGVAALWGTVGTAAAEHARSQKHIAGEHPAATLGKHGWGAFFFPDLNSTAWQHIDPFSVPGEGATTVESAWIRVRSVTDTQAHHPQLSSPDMENALRFGLPEGDQLTEFEQTLADGKRNGEIKIVLDPEQGTVAYRISRGSEGSDYYTRYGELIYSVEAPGLETPPITPGDVVGIARIATAGAGKLGNYVLRSIGKRSAREAADSALDPQHLQSVMRELREAIPESSGGRKTVALGLVEDSDGARYLVWTANRNWTNRASLEVAARRLNVARWTAAPRAVGRGAVGAPGDAEQILIEAAEANSMRVIAIVPSRAACPDCASAITAEGITLIQPPD
jgi:hypothetical protein